MPRCRLYCHHSSYSIAIHLLQTVFHSSSCCYRSSSWRCCCFVNHIIFLDIESEKKVQTECKGGSRTAERRTQIDRKGNRSKFVTARLPLFAQWFKVSKESSTEEIGKTLKLKKRFWHSCKIIIYRWAPFLLLLMPLPRSKRAKRAMRATFSHMNFRTQNTSFAGRCLHYVCCYF